MNPKDFYNKTAEKYDERHNNVTARHMRSMEKRLIRRYARGKVLDIGCGTGEQLKLMPGATGLDISASMVEEARKKVDSFLVAGKAEFLPFRDESFDSAVCMFTVLNLCHAEKAVAEMKRILKSNGLAIISVASIWDKKEASLLRRLVSKPMSETKSVRIENERLQFFLFSKEELKMLFEKHGFAMVRFDGMYSVQRPYWGWHRDFNILEKAKLKIERLLPKHAARLYFCVFRRG